MPPSWRSQAMYPRRPVIISCADRSGGRRPTRAVARACRTWCSAIVSSTLSRPSSASALVATASAARSAACRLRAKLQRVRARPLEPIALTVGRLSCCTQVLAGGLAGASRRRRGDRRERRRPPGRPGATQRRDGRLRPLPCDRPACRTAPTIGAWPCSSAPSCGSAAPAQLLLGHTGWPRLAADGLPDRFRAVRVVLRRRGARQRALTCAW